MILLFLLPFYDRSPERRIERRPIALAAGLATIFAMAFLTYSGANTGSPNSVDLPPPAVAHRRPEGDVPRRRGGRRPVGLPGLPRDRDNGNNGPGPPLTNIGSIRRPQAIASTLRNPTAPMPSFADLAKNNPEKFKNLVNFLSSSSRPVASRDHDGETNFAAGPLRHGRP